MKPELEKCLVLLRALVGGRQDRTPIGEEKVRTAMDYYMAAITLEARKAALRELDTAARPIIGTSTDSLIVTYLQHLQGMLDGEEEEAFSELKRT